MVIAPPSPVPPRNTASTQMDVHRSNGSHLAFPFVVAALVALFFSLGDSPEPNPQHLPPPPHLPAGLEPKHAQLLAEKALVAAVSRARVPSSKELILREEGERSGASLVATESVIVGKLYKYQLVERISPPEYAAGKRAIESADTSEARNPLLLLASPGRHYLTPWRSDGDDDGFFGGRYRLKNRFAKGNHGEVWHANGMAREAGAVGKTPQLEDFVLKRIFVERGEHLRRSGEREVCPWG